MMASWAMHPQQMIDKNKKDKKAKVIAISSLLNPVTNSNISSSRSYRGDPSQFQANSGIYSTHHSSLSGSRSFGSNVISGHAGSSPRYQFTQREQQQIRSNSCPQVTYGIEMNAAQSPPSPGIGLGSRKYVCGICGKKYMTAAHLTRHEATHTGVKPYECPYPGCGSRFSRNDNCMQHFKTHSNPKGKTSRRMQRLQGEGR